MKDFAEKLLSFLSQPSTALLTILFFLVGFFLAEGLYFGFGNNFLSFGPTNDTTGEPTKFMGISLKSWTDVSIAYVIIFISTLLQSYYGWIVGNDISSYIFNPAVKQIPYDKFWTYLILTINPVIKTMLFVINFFATATLQMQFIIPQFLANYLANLPFTLSWLNKKKFAK
jgi:hypothetical protein